jgi:hypothetical protein
MGMKGEEVGKDFSSRFRSHRIEPECMDAISPTAKLHCEVLSANPDRQTDRQTYAQLSGHSRDSATNGNKDRRKALDKCVCLSFATFPSASFLSLL